ncbi:MAG TPA: SusD/RagB family nutrient-binding outer membrane lipoprotein, partial [Chitinophagaceae bacterium]
MINIFRRLIPACLILLFTGCDKDFEKINTNPYAVTSIDPALLFAGAQRTHIGTWNAEHIIVQQFVVPYNTGATQGFSFNIDIDGNSNPKWGEYNSSIKNMIQALNILNVDGARKNLINMIRIWKAQVFMGMVDAYADVPYSEAGKAVSDALFYPKYDDDAAIYNDLYKELKEAIAGLSTTGDYVSADLFYGANAHATTKTTNANDQVTKWKKLGNSLLLRLGMRYSKLDANKAKTIVAEALAGGVMTSNADNALVKYDGSIYLDGDNNVLRNFSQFNYAAEPFVNQLKSTSDPRAQFMIAQFADPGNITADPNPDVTLANQYGVPIGIENGVLENPPHRGKRGGGLAYSQFNINKLASPAAPNFWVTYAQTSLLLAEAAKQGWIAGGDAQAKTYYENAITADMQAYALYPGTTPISAAAITAYINDPSVLYNAADALKLINTQYWIVNIRNGTEAFANFRRSGFPALTPNPVSGDLSGPGFARRLSYPNVEASANTANYTAGATAIGGDELSSRVFW